MARRGAILGACALLLSLAACSSKPVPEDAPTPVHAVRTRIHVPAPPTQDASPPLTDVAPGSLSRGPDPQVPWIDPTSGVLHDGARTVATGLRRVRELYVAGSSYLVATEGQEGLDLHRVDRDGQQQELSQDTDPGVVVSPTGDLYAYTRSTQDSYTVIVANIADGSLLAQSRFSTAPTGYAVSLVALRGQRLLMSRADLTWWWDYVDGQVTPIAHGQAGAVSPDHDRIVTSHLEDTGRWAVTGTGSAGEPGRDAWSLPRDWVPRDFSPRGELLVTGRQRPDSGQEVDVYDDRLRVSTSVGGAAVHDFAGVFGHGLGGPVWESNSTFDVLVGGPDAAGSDALTLVWARCTTQGDCEAASPEFRFDLTTSPQVPVWVLAQPS